MLYFKTFVFIWKLYSTTFLVKFAFYYEYLFQYIRKIVPPPPQENAITANSIEVKWTKPADMNVQENFELQFRENSPKGRWESLPKYLSSAITITTFPGLNPDTEYIFKVRVVDMSDESTSNKFSNCSLPIKTYKVLLTLFSLMGFVLVSPWCYKRLQFLQLRLPVICFHTCHGIISARGKCKKKWHCPKRKNFHFYGKHITEICTPKMFY